MKKFLLSMLAAVCTLGVQAQNVQLHYDLGHSLNSNLSGRQSVTTTVEMFRPDTWGSTYFFVDLDYERDGVMGAYWEISREFSLCNKNQFAAHVEYNGGVGSGKTGEEGFGNYYGNRYQHALLLGPAWNWHSADFSRTFSLQAMYKQYFKNRHNGRDAFSGYQLTAVWGIKFANGWCDFSGFVDFWRDPTVRGKHIFLSEPQFWLNLNKVRGWDKINLSVGTEVELSNNFVWNNYGDNSKFYAIPTIAAKWAF